MRLLPSMCVLAAIVVTVSGCASPSSIPPNVPTTVTTSTPSGGSQTTSSTGSGGASASAGARSASGVSAKSLDYAKSLGGWDHKGKTLYFIVGGTYSSESAAQAALDKAMPHFDDGQPYFIVQRSDNFEGMAPGQWVVVEAHFKNPSSDNLEFARRGFPGAHVQRARVVVSDPIPVYEDLVGGD